MDRLVNKYADKLIQAGLGSSEGDNRPLVGGLDDTLVWNRKSKNTVVLEKIFDQLSINSLVFLRPVRPYRDLLAYLGRETLGSKDSCIRPRDCETRTFLHDLPVIDTFCPDRIAAVLKNRKSVIVLPEPGGKKDIGPAIIAHGTVSPEQPFVTISSVCFAGFVKFFTDYLEHLRSKSCSEKEHEVFDSVCRMIEPPPAKPPELLQFPFDSETDVRAAIVEAGKKTVEYQLVDSYFGNVSYLWNDTLYISQTGSSLDDLAMCIDPVPLDHSTSAGLTASSELSAHLETIARTGCSAILHGHPKFSVILSMDCEPEERKNCPDNQVCHIRCPKKRFAAGSPIVSGEVGTGPTGLCNTLPAALEDSDNAIVYGHGLFTTSQTDFSHAFNTLLAVERRCFETYFGFIKDLRY